MSTLLHVSAGVRSQGSHSRRYGNYVIEKIQAARSDLTLRRRDLCRPFLPHPSESFVRATLMSADERSAEDHASLALSEQLVEEIETAEAVVIDLPMHNFTIPSTLKAWIDYIVRPQRTFRSISSGKIGLLADRSVFCVMTCGGPVVDAGMQPDFGTPYLLHIFETMGIRSVSVFIADNLRRGDLAMDEANKRFAAWLSSIPKENPLFRRRD